MTNTTLRFHSARCGRIPGSGRRTPMLSPQASGSQTGGMAETRTAPASPGCKQRQARAGRHPRRPRRPPLRGAPAKCPSRIIFSANSSPPGSRKNTLAALGPIYHGSFSKKKAKCRNCSPSIRHPQGLPLQHHHYANTKQQSQLLNFLLFPPPV